VPGLIATSLTVLMQLCKELHMNDSEHTSYLACFTAQARVDQLMLKKLKALQIVINHTHDDIGLSDAMGAIAGRSRTIHIKSETTQRWSCNDSAQHKGRVSEFIL
jgi:hypothetical protein